MSSQGVMYSKEASQSPGLCPVKGEYPSPVNILAEFSLAK